MPRRRLLTAALLAAATFAGPARAQDHPLRLEEAVRLAVSRNERARIAELNVVTAEAGVEKARSGFLPVVSLANVGTHRFQPQPRQPSNVGTATLTLNQPLINATAWPLYGQAKSQLEGQRAQSTDDKRLLGFDAAKEFLSVLTSQALLEAAKRREDSAKANLADTRARVDAQLVSSNDATRALVDVSGATREVEVGRGNLETAYLGLAFVMNANVPRELAKPDALLSAARNPLPKMDALVRIAIANRPDLRSKRHLANAAHKFAEEPMLRLVPTLGLQGQAQATTNPTTPGHWNDESASLTLSWTLYDAGVRYADKHSRDATAEIADLNVRALYRGVDNQVRTAVVTLQSAQATLRAAEESLKAAAQSAEETEILYKQGLAKAIELIDANDQRFQADVAVANADFQVALAYLALRQALGLDATGTDIR